MGTKGMSIFERYLTVWVGLCIVAEIALGKIVGVLIEVPIMLMLVKICLRTQAWFPPRRSV